MDKKIFVLAALAGACISGCVSLSDPKALSSLEAVALVSINSNSDIVWSDAEEEEESGGLLKGVVNILSNEGKKAGEKEAALLSRADTLIEDARAALEGRLSASGALKLLPPKQVLGSKSYATAKEDSLAAMAALKPKGYKFVQISDKRLVSSLKAELGAEAALHAVFKFEKTMMSGIGRNGSMTANVTLSVTAVNAEGKVIFSDSYASMGVSDIPVIAGIYDPIALNEDLKAAASKACAKFLEALE